jgi:DcaP outer membrane protein
LNDGQYLNQRFLGGTGTLSGDVHPFSGNPGPLGRDDLGFGAAGGNDTGGQIANGHGVATNFGAPIFVTGLGWVNPLNAATPTGLAPLLTTAWNAHSSTQSLGANAIVNGINVRQAYDRLVRTQATSTVAGWIWYQHWWTENLRSTIETSGILAGINTNIIGQNPTATSKLLAMAHANLYWSPVAFVDFGVEYAWGHRVSTANFKGDSNTILGEVRVRF